MLQALVASLLFLFAVPGAEPTPEIRNSWLTNNKIQVKRKTNKKSYFMGMMDISEF